MNRNIFVKNIRYDLKQPHFYSRIGLGNNLNVKSNEIECESCSEIECEIESEIE